MHTALVAAALSTCGGVREWTNCGVPIFAMVSSGGLRQNVLVGLTRQLEAKVLRKVARLEFLPGHSEVENTEKGR